MLRPIIYSNSVPLEIPQLTNPTLKVSCPFLPRMNQHAASPFTFSIGQKRRTNDPFPADLAGVRVKRCFSGGAARVRGHNKKSRGQKRQTEPTWHNVSVKSSCGACLKPADFSFEPFLANNTRDDETKADDSLVGRLSSKSRTRSTLSSAATVRYILSATRVSHACGKVPSDRKKTTRITANPIGETGCTLMMKKRNWEGCSQYLASDYENRMYSYTMYKISC